MYIYNLCLSAAGTDEISRVLYHKKLLVAQVPIFTLKHYTTLYHHTNRDYPTVPWQTLSSNYFSQIPQYIMYYTESGISKCFMPGIRPIGNSY